MDTLHEKKTEIIKTIQEYYEDCHRINESNIQKKCESDLQIYSLLDTIRKQEAIISLNQTEKEELEKQNLQKDKQIHEYSELIKKFENKLHELSIEKEEEDRFNILRIQADTIHEKETEIERLNGILQKQNNKKVLNVIDLIETNISDDDISITVIKNDPEKIMVESKETTIVKETDASSDTKDEADEDEEADDYDIIVYRKKEYWIKKDENPQYVYEVIGDDGLGDRLGIYKKDINGKMKVFIDK